MKFKNPQGILYSDAALAREIRVQSRAIDRYTGGPIVVDGQTVGFKIGRPKPVPLDVVLYGAIRETAEQVRESALPEDAK